MVTRRDPMGNILPPRLYYKHRAYYHVADNRWRRLGTVYAEVLREWARLEGAVRNATTFAQAAEAWLLDARPGLAKETIRGYESSLRRLLPVFGICQIDEIEAPDVKAYLRARSAKIAANREKACLSAVFSFAVGEGWCERNPCKDVSRNTEKPRRRTATDEEIAKLAALATPMWRAIMAVALLIGARPGELRTLKRADLTEEGIRLDRSKTGTASLIEWTPALKLATDAALAAGAELAAKRGERRGVAEIPSLYLFPASTGRPYSMGGFSRVWTRLCQEAGIEGLQMRDARRTAATAADDMEHARALLGHTTSGITARVYRVRERVKPVG